MSEKICPNCFFKNKSTDDFCQECESILDLEDYIESKKFDKTDFNKLKAIVYGEKKTNEINREIEEFIILSQNFHDYKIDLINLKSGKFNKTEFKDKYKIISKLDDFRYLVEINNDSDLNKKLLLMKSVKTFINNFDDEIKKSETLLSDINLKIKGIESFDKDLDDLLNSDFILDVSHKNKLIQSHKFTYDFFDRPKVKELNIDSKEKIRIFLNTYESIDSIIENRNEKFRISKHNELVSKNVKKTKDFVDKINKFKQSDDFIPKTVVGEIKSEFQKSYDFLIEEDISKLKISTQLKSNISYFLDNFNNLNELIDKINEELSIKILQNKVNDNVDNLKQFNDDLNNLLESNFYITFKQKDELKNHYQDLFDLISEADTKIEISDDFKQFLKTYPAIYSIIDSRNEKYVENELIEHKDFFDNIDGKSLDINQRLAVVKNEQNSQIIAGAGCGKTLTVNAKVRYLIEKKGVNPNEILCLSFSNLSVGDLKEKLPSGVEIATFHKLGGSILEANDKPARPDTDAMENYVKEYFRKHVINNEKLCEDIFEFYSYYLYTSIDEDQATSLGEVYDLEEGKDFRTLRDLYGGDKEKITYDNKKVKSLEELIISNYLFAHQIDYEYEKIFEFKNRYYLTQKEFVYNLLFEEIDEFNEYPVVMDDLLSNLFNLLEIKENVKLKNYSPDFYLKENDIYLEHFGVNRDCDALWLDEEGSAKYKSGIIWKRQLHKNYGSNLLETYSYYMSENRLLSGLEEKLMKAGVEIKEIDYEYLLSKIVERDSVNRFVSFINLITTFIQLFKGNDYTIDKFNEFRKENENNEDDFDKKRTSLFLNIVEDIYIAYENHLKEISKIDFNDMINNATKEVRKGNLHKHYRYILVDEYQDTSYTRYNLVKAIQDKTGAKVCVVGDDWQSIYRFTGCDVALFSKFENYFKNPEKLAIETTYRNSQELIDITGRFIKKNPNQINKSLKSKKDSSHKPVKIAYYNNNSKEDKIKTMEFLIDKISKESNDIMILGRNNFDINDFVEGNLFKRKRQDEPELIYEKNKDLNINFISVHKSKGLEEDNVILINLENKVTGFPNQMIDDPLMNFVITDSDQFPHGEERRLFYVALTRTKNNTYLLVPDTDKSEFVLELEENLDDLDILSKNSNEEVYDDIDTFMENKNVYSIKTRLKCPVCKTGDIILKIIKSKKGNDIFKFFECSHKRCDWEGGNYYADLELLNEIEICPDCGNIRYVTNGKYGPYLRCVNKCKTPKLQGEKLKRVNKILDELDDTDYEFQKTNLTCSKCGKGVVTLKINPETKKQQFICSNDDCDFDGGFTNIDKSKLNEIKTCPECGGILILRKGKYGKFFSCNSRNCKYTENIRDNKIDNIDFEDIKVNLKCPECGVGTVIIRKNNKSNQGKVVCSSCSWDGGSFDKTGKIDSIEYCKAPNCNGITYLREGRYGEFRTCSNYFKTKCKGKGENKINYSKTEKSSYNEHIKPSVDDKSFKPNTKPKYNNFEDIKVNLKCPECGIGNVIVRKNNRSNQGKVVCSSCSWDGGSFDKTGKIDSIEYCKAPNCNGITYLRDGKFGEFRTCSNYFKTKCNGKGDSKLKYSNKKKPKSKWEKIDTDLICPVCEKGDVILLKNIETEKGFFKCTNDDCDWNGGSFNKSEDLLDSLALCPEFGCDGLTYGIEGKYGPFRVCTYFSKTGCKAGRQ